MYVINVLMTSLTSFILSMVSINNNMDLFLVYLVLTAVCALAYWSMVHRTPGAGESLPGSRLD